ncbi:hypothetical protein [Nitrospirillum pindoramense]|uniref:Uncharacterized protein n=1 Tax=Nitrospirillum amazonense TaxID=28077 RepID=A0A560HIK1_9PROT|nr:hypothetical protein [Nitrospirillum amazonense]TWB45831.1 hypothetical protein FBZ90_101166 [Nitrospirillum amazonense]
MSDAVPIMTTDCCGRSWEFVRSVRVNGLDGLSLFFGKPADRIGRRGRLSVIPTTALIDYVDEHRDHLQEAGLPLSLPILRRLAEVATEREQFRAAAPVRRRVQRQPLSDSSRRRRGWWREPEVAALMLQEEMPQRHIAIRLGISPAEVSLYRRALLREGGATVVPRKLHVR